LRGCNVVSALDGDDGGGLKWQRILDGGIRSLRPGVFAGAALFGCPPAHTSVGSSLEAQGLEMANLDHDEKSLPRLLRRWRGPSLAFAIGHVCLFAVAVSAAQSASAPSAIDAALAQPAAPTGDEAQQEYIIGPEDKLDITVFEVKDLSLAGVPVDASGQIILPLIGTVTASGKTTAQLSQEIASRLGEKYLQSPQVSVVVSDSASRKVTVEGEVRTPGVYKMPGRTTLMEAIAMGGGLGDTANLHKVAIIRTVNGRRRAILCDYADVRSGRIADPAIEPQDVVVVDGSTSKSVWQTVLRSAPIIALLAAAA
jgi:polysaccharide export outer membrane protein